MTESYWDQPLGKGSGLYLAYNASHIGLSALDMPGTDAYFNTVMGGLRREAERRPGHFAEIVPKASKLKYKVIRTTADSLSPQRCATCDRMMQGEPCKVPSKAPVVFCLPCATGPCAGWGYKDEENWGTLEDGRIST